MASVLDFDIYCRLHMKKKKNFTSRGQPTRLITCANHGNNVVQTVYNVVQNPHVVLLSRKGAHGASARCEKACMLLPQKEIGQYMRSARVCLLKRISQVDVLCTKALR